MGIHQPPKTHPHRTIQSAVMIPCLFPTCKSTAPYIYLFSVLRIICLLCSIEHWVDSVLTKRKYNFLAYLSILYEKITL